MKSAYSALVVALFIVLAASVSFGQVVSVHLTLTNGGQTDTSSFGIAAAGATKCIDAGLSEAEQPPFPPAGAIFSAFTELSCLGNGLKWDIHPFAAKDTFKLKIQLADENLTEASIAWNKTLVAAIVKSGGTATMSGGGVTANMLTDDAFNWDPSSVTVASVRIIIEWKPLGVLEQTSKVPVSFALGQNYPNPFNPSTVVPFSVQKSGFTEVVVYNILGQKVATLVSEQLNPGTYNAKWNGSDDRGMSVSTGVYYVRMTSNYGNNESFTQMHKMLLMK